MPKHAGPVISAEVWSTVLPTPGPRPRRVCPWHLLDLVDEGGELLCPVGQGHAPRAWLAVDARGRILAAGRDCADEPGAVLVDPPMRLSGYVSGIWLRLRWSRRTFGAGAQKMRAPVAARESLVARKKSVEKRDLSEAAPAA